jgi:hypothetical protein
VITATVNRLPDAVLTDKPELVAQVAPTLLGYARTLDPDRPAVLARTVAACLDPDGQLVAEKNHQRDRSVTLAVLPDGSGRLAATVTAEAAAVWTTILDTLAHPVPADDDQPDRHSDQDHHLQLALVNAALAIGATMLAADESSRPSS